MTTTEVNVFFTEHGDGTPMISLSDPAKEWCIAATITGEQVRKLHAACGAWLKSANRSTDRGDKSSEPCACVECGLEGEHEADCETAAIAEHRVIEAAKVWRNAQTAGPREWREACDVLSVAVDALWGR
jgi:hypothetical protein